MENLNLSHLIVFSQLLFCFVLLILGWVAQTVAERSAGLWALLALQGRAGVPSLQPSLALELQELQRSPASPEPTRPFPETLLGGNTKVPLALQGTGAFTQGCSCLVLWQQGAIIA